MTSYRVILADDHVMVRQGLKRIIEEVGDLKVTGEANDGLELLGLLKKLPAELVVLDISMPHLRGIEAIHEIKAMHPHVKILILSMHDDVELLIAAITAGADGYVLKEAADRDLLSAIEKIQQGGTYLSRKLSDELTDRWARTGGGEDVPETDDDLLSVREREVLKLTAEGKSSKEIAGLLYISHRTVEHHRANIMAKLHLKRTVDLVRYAISKRYL